MAAAEYLGADDRSRHPGADCAGHAVVVFVSIQKDADLDQYKGKLAGKVVLFGAMREVPPVDKALFTRYTEKELEDLAEFPVNAGGGGLSPEMQARLRER